MVDRLELERRVMIAALVSSCLAAVIWLTAITTNEWCSVTFDEWRLINSSTRRTVNTYVKIYNIGLWKLCAYLYFNATNSSLTIGPKFQCKTLKISSEGAEDDSTLDETLMHHRRSTSAMAIIAMCLSPVAIGFGAYALKQARYMFKRVASAVHFITAAAAMVSIEVFRGMLHYMNDKVKGYDWFRGSFQYGFSFGFAWVTFILLVLSGIAFLAVSGKRKRDKALSEREAVENEPVQLGRA